MSEKKNKCETLDLYHAWEDMTPNIIYPTHPPQYPPHTEKCRNCGLIRKLIITHNENWEYDHSEEKKASDE